jgi:uncharacterized membrane protein HdeD (DUF308 family)
LSEEEDSVWFTVTEKFFGLLIILIGTIIAYITTTSPALSFSILFSVCGLALIVVGVFMVLSKTK